MFNSNKNSVTTEQVEAIIEPLTKRIKALEDQLADLTERMADLEKLQAQSVCPDDEHHESADAGENSEQSNSEPTSPVATDACSPELASSQTQSFFLPAPTPDGIFTNPSSNEELGKSIYQMYTTDGQIGEFEILSSPDAIATAMISVSQFVKPACKVEGNIHQQPQRIETVQCGTVQKKGDAWRVVTKAVVKFV